MVVPTTSLAQARDIDILIFKLQELRGDESELEQDVKTASEKVKKLKASLEEVRAKKNKIIDELSGKKAYPLFDEIKKLETELEAEQDRLETDPIAASDEAPAQEATELVTEIKLERVGEAARLTFGDKVIEISLEELEYRYVPQEENKEENATYDQIMEAGWQALNKLNQGELFVLWQDYAPEPEENTETNNVVNFFGSQEATTEITPDETLNKDPDYSKTTYIDTTPEREQTEQTEEKALFQAYVDNDDRLCISYDHGERKSAYGSAAKILDRFGISSVAKLKREHLAQLWQEDPSDWSYKVEVNNSEQWPELIYVFSKPDGSIILKLANRTRKIDAGIVTLGDIDFDSQDELNKLWLSDKAYDYNPAQDKIEISSLSGKKPTRKRKPAEVAL
ncbi:MAG: hypothetical protein WAQ98_25740 [Blastocatellia bacterium]